MMRVSELKAALEPLPDDAQVDVVVGAAEWIIASLWYDPEPTVVPGTYGQERQPTFHIQIGE